MHYQTVKEDIGRIALAAGRDPAEITLVAVSKGHLWEEARAAHELGCRDFGENRVQEALLKMADSPNDVRWHFIGTIQKNKVQKIVGHFVLIHSVDSFELAKEIAHNSEERNVTTAVLLQVNTSKEASKHGFSPDELKGEFEKVAKLPHLQIEGLMTMAPFVEEEKVIRTCFAKLRELKEELGLKQLSMGMSHDYPIAIQEGATLLRIGTAIFGK